MKLNNLKVIGQIIKFYPMAFFIYNKYYKKNVNNNVSICG